MLMVLSTMAVAFAAVTLAVVATKTDAGIHPGILLFTALSCVLLAAQVFGVVDTAVAAALCLELFRKDGEVHTLAVQT